MRVLVVADEYPWPTLSGYRLRLAAVLRALSQTAEVDLLSVVYPGGAPDLAEHPPACALRRLRVVAAPGRRRGRGQLLLRWAATRQPRALLRRDWSEARSALTHWSGSTYDAVWFSHAVTYAALGDVVPPPHVVDLDNLETFVLHHRRSRDRTAQAQRSTRARAIAAMVRWADRVDERRWQRLETQIADRAHSVVVCSDLDRDRLASPKGRVVPNGYQREDDVPLERPDGESHVALMIGLLSYEPNHDAARWFTSHVLPPLRSRLPDVQFRVVGRYDTLAHVQGVIDVPGVSVAGSVPDVRPELAAAGVAVVPVRFGGGTRIKILEAFAYGVPVVSTSTGCEGLDVVPGEHLLVADDPDAFAAACARVLTDPALRQRLTRAAHVLWRERYRWSTIEPTIRAVVEDAAGG